MDKEKFKKYKTGKKNRIEIVDYTDTGDEIKPVEPEKRIEEENKPIEKTPFTELFARKQKGRRSLDDKVLACLLIDMTQEQNDEDLSHPNYQWNTVSDLTGVTITTLQKWWSNKNKIMQLAEGVSTKMNKLLVLKMSSEVMRLMESLGRTDYDKESLRDKTSLMNNILTKMTDISDRVNSLQNRNVENARFVAVLPTEIGE